MDDKGNKHYYFQISFGEYFMDYQAIFIFCLCENVLKSLNITDDKQCRMTNSEIMTFAILSSLYFQCNYRKTRIVLKQCRYFSRMLSNSRFNRRIHQIPTPAWRITLEICKEVLGADEGKNYIVDSFPVAACQNNKIFRCKLFQGKEYHGYTASKKSYFWGIKVHMITNLKGVPIEFCFTPGGESDIRAFKRFECNLPRGSRIYADKAYNDYGYEDLLNDCTGIRLVPKRKKNLKRRNLIHDEFFLSFNRSKIETAFSAITHLMPRCIRAVTAQGFILKVLFFILGYTVKHIMPVE